MAQSEERPSKIRKLDSDLDDDQVAEFAPLTDVGSLKRSKHEAVSSTESEDAEVLHSASKEDETVSLGLNGNDHVHETNPSQPLSKNQLKKLRNKQKWEEGREYRKAKRREKDKEKKIRRAEARATADPQSAENFVPTPDIPKKSSQRPLQLPITFVLDCDFDDLMTEAELISLGSQLTRCYSDNRSAPYRAHLVVSSFGGKLKHRFETVLANNHLGWKGVKFTADDFVAAAKEADAMMRGSQGGQLVGAFAGVSDAVPLQQQSPSQHTGKSRSPTMVSSGSTLASEAVPEKTFSDTKLPAANGATTASMERAISPSLATETEESGGISNGTAVGVPGAQVDDQGLKPSHEPSIVYLTSDSSHTLDVLNPYTTYIIGGLVDKNRHKGICYKRAMARDIPTAKLPIGEYMTMQSRSVLATNHVAEIMLRWLEYGDWARAFLQVIPKRKEARLKVRQGTGVDLRNKEDGNASSGSQGDQNSERDGNQDIMT
jgi:tRNA (guanine9-N1)-methyltransferase